MTGKWRENLILNLGLKLNLVKFELNLKVFEVFLKNIFGFPLLLDSGIRGLTIQEGVFFGVYRFLAGF